MTNENRKIFREIVEFLPPGVPKKGYEKFKSFKFSFENLTRVQRDDAIAASRGTRSTDVSKTKKISRNQVYKIWRRK